MTEYCTRVFAVLPAGSRNVTLVPETVICPAPACTISMRAPVGRQLLRRQHLHRQQSGGARLIDVLHVHRDRGDGHRGRAVAIAAEHRQLHADRLPQRVGNVGPAAPVGFVAGAGINAVLRSSAPSAVAGDFDNDMDMDIFYDGGSGVGTTKADLRNVILWNRGDGTFVVDVQAAGAHGPGFGSPPDMVTTADYDGDGNLDILLTYFNNPISTVQLYRNKGNGNHWGAVWNVVGIAVMVSPAV